MGVGRLPGFVGCSTRTAGPHGVGVRMWTRGEAKEIGLTTPRRFAERLGYLAGPAAYRAWSASGDVMKALHVKAHGKAGTRRKPFNSSPAGVNSISSARLHVQRTSMGVHRTCR